MDLVCFFTVFYLFLFKFLPWYGEILHCFDILPAGGKSCQDKHLNLAVPSTVSCQNKTNRNLLLKKGPSSHLSLIISQDLIACEVAKWYFLLRAHLLSFISGWNWEELDVHNCHMISYIYRCMLRHQVYFQHLLSWL